MTYKVWYQAFELVRANLETGKEEAVWVCACREEARQAARVHNSYAKKAGLSTVILWKVRAI